MIIISLISIYNEFSLEVKIEIYHQTISVITKYIFKSWLLCILIGLGIILVKVVVKGILIMGVNGSVWQCHPIIIGISIDNEE